MYTYPIVDFGAVADGTTNNAPAIQAAVDACAAAGGGQVIVPPAKRAFVSGTIELRPRVELHLANGAVLRASANPADYREQRIAGEYGGNTGAFLIHADKANGIAISGQGVIDGFAEAFLDGWWTDDGPYIRRPKDFRPRVIGLFGCQNVRLHHFTVRDAPQWSCHLTGCRDVVIHGITILNGLDVPNCDGIDPDHCQNVRISDCHIEAGDDGIVIKTTREYTEYGPSENITVSGCTIVSTSAAIKIGTESQSDIRDITVTNCVIRRSHRGLAIQLRDGGNVENIHFSNCIVETRQFHPKWWGNAEAVYLTAVPRHADTRVGRIRNVLCSHLTCRGENGIFLHGTPDTPLENIRFDHVQVELAKTTRWPIDFHDLRPYKSAEHGGLDEAPLAILTARHVKGLELRACSLQSHPEDAHHWSGKIDCADVQGGFMDGKKLG
jgi:hypothetical protein